MSELMPTQWWFKDSESREFAQWDWALGAPRVRSLISVRTPRSGDRSSHVPVRAYSACTRTMLHLESGLEHDLVRRLDRDSTVTWMVPQPCRLVFTGDGRPRKHVPDLLVLSASGQVTLWDARPAEKADEKFFRTAEVTAAACAQVGWTHRVFHGLALVERLNLLWLHGYRRDLEWHDRWTYRLLEHLAAAEGPVTLGEMLELDDGSGEGISTMWHLLWAGVIGIDVTANWDATTPVHLPAADAEARA